MKTSYHGSFAVAALCAFLVACGGGGGDSTPPTPPAPPAPTVLPDSVAITNDARAEAETAATFHTDLATTSGLTFRWDFGDGTTGNGPTPTHAYARTGTYSVTLAVANDAEDLRTATSTIQVGAYANVSGLSCTQGDSAGWCWQHAIVTGQQVNDIFFVDATHAWAVGDDLTILKSTDAGVTWTVVTLDPSLAPASLRSVRFYDGNHGMALDNQGGALQTVDGGATWTAVVFGTATGGPMTFAAYGANRIVLQSPSWGTSVLSTDGGNSWSAIAIGAPIQATSTDCWSFGTYGVLRGANCGSTQTTALTLSVNNGYITTASGAFVSDNQAVIIASGYSYTTWPTPALGWSTTDGGTTWTSFTPNGLPLYYYSFYGLTLNMINTQSGMFYSPGALTAYATLDGGLDWTEVTPSPALTQAQTWNSSVAAGVVGKMFWQSVDNHVSLSPDRGTTWHDVTVHAEDAAATNAHAAAAVTQYVDANDFIVAIGSRFYVTADGGQTFRQMFGADSRDVGAQAAAGQFTDLHHGTFLTSNGALLSTADGGRTWTRQDYSTTTVGGVALHFNADNDGWLVLDGKLAHSTDGGATWSLPLTNSEMVTLQGMSWGDASHGWTWNGTQLFYTADAGATWHKSPLPANSYISSAAMTGAFTGVVSFSWSGGLTTQDGGATWQALPSNLHLGTLVHTRGQTVWSFYGGAARSKDGGRTWQTMLSNGVNYTGIDFADELHGWLVGSNGTVLRTIDGGDSWSAQPVGPDITALGVVAVDPVTAWIITGNGQILSTATAGE